MWLLQSLKATDTKIYLLVGENYQVGRKDCRIVCAKDQSVSRKHAAIKVSHPEGNLAKPSLLPTVTLTDSSKFGTLVNGVKIALSSTVTLKDGDQLVFGAMNTNKWKLTYSSLVVAFSSIPSAEKKQLKSLVLSLGGHVASDWNKDCTMLIMSQLSVTIKVTAALISCRPIVTPQYLHALKQAAKSDTAMPQITDFRPPVVEEAIDTNEVNFDPNPVRSRIFNGKTFIFVVEKQLKQLGRTIQLGGGDVILMSEGDKETFSLLTKPDSIVMYADPDDNTQAHTQETQDYIREVMVHLKQHGLRAIPISELGLAVLYASTELHCNPKVAQAGLNLLNAAPSQPTLDAAVLAPDTEASCSNIPSTNPRQRMIVDETVDSTSVAGDRKSAQQTKKRARQDSAPAETASKIAKIEPPSPATREKAHSSKIDVAETPQKSSESFPPVPSIKTSPEFSYVGQPESPKQNPVIKEEIVSPPPAVRNSRGHSSNVEQPKGQRSEVKNEVQEEEEAMDMESETEPSPVKRRGRSVRASGSENAAKDMNMESETEPSPVKRRSRSTMASGSGNAAKDNGQKKGRGTTQDSIWDEIGGGRKKQKTKEEVPLEQEEPEEEKPVSKTPADLVEEEGDSQNSMWTKKRKRNVLEQIAEDEARESQHSQEQVETDSRDFNQVLTDVPGGFVTTANHPKVSAVTKVEAKDEPEAGDAPLYANVAIEESNLVVRRPKPRQPRPAVIARTNVKNFKNFRKAGYAGQTGMPHIIGGRDLVAHDNAPNDEIDDMMFGGLQAEQRRTKDEELAERLFADAAHKPTKRRGKRK